MTTNGKALAGATNTDQGTENLAEGLSTDNDTRTAPKPRKRKPLVFHIVHAQDAAVLRTVCGTTIPKRRAVYAENPSGDPRERVQCPDCRMLYDLNEDMKAQLKRQERAEAITEMVMRHLENGEV